MDNIQESELPPVSKTGSKARSEDFNKKRAEYLRSAAGIEKRRRSKTTAKKNVPTVLNQTKGNDYD